MQYETKTQKIHTNNNKKKKYNAHIVMHHESEARSDKTEINLCTAKEAHCDKTFAPL